MRKAYLVALPPGAGKTRTVLKDIRKRTSNNFKTVCRNLLVVGPNKRVEHVWLREAALLLHEDNKKLHADIRQLTTGDLRKLLRKLDCSIEFLSFKEVKNKTYIAPTAFIVIDEWHRLNLTKPEALTALKQGPLGNHTYFVSATPLNPVLESEVDSLNESPDDDVTTIRECRGKALSTIAALTNIPINDALDLSFNKAIKRMGVHWVNRKTGWCAPEQGQPCTQALPFESELANFRQNTALDAPDWKSKEAAWAIGLVKTRYIKASKQFFIGSAAVSKNLVFGHPYANPLVAPEKKGMLATDWLLQRHTRVPRLLHLLQQIGIIVPTDKSSTFLFTSKKVVIFCVHQGVARGLQLALASVLECGERNIFCDIHEDLDDEHQANFMRTEQPPYLLIATDKLSESIDLHGDCFTLIHYELPWSPLRLLQRVGRLTRMREDRRFKHTEIYHIMIPGSVEEERVNRLVRRTALLHDEGAWPPELYGIDSNNSIQIATALIGSGPSMHLQEVAGRA